MVFETLLASQILRLFWAQVLSNRINKISLKFSRCANQTYLYISSRKSLVSIICRRRLSVQYFFRRLSSFFFSVTARSENN